jgi:ACR3 family arsenite transporter
MASSQPPITQEQDAKEMDNLDPPLFRQSCTNCDFCEGLRDMDAVQEEKRPDAVGSAVSAAGEFWEQNLDIRTRSSYVYSALFKSLSFFDRYLAIFILLAMIAGVLIGVYKARIFVPKNPTWC